MVLNHTVKHSLLKLYATLDGNLPLSAAFKVMVKKVGLLFVDVVQYVT